MLLVATIDFYSNIVYSLNDLDKFPLNPTSLDQQLSHHVRSNHELTDMVFFKRVYTYLLDRRWNSEQGNACLIKSI